MSIKHAFIVPLIGGQALGQAAAFGSMPEFMESYQNFVKNDQHIRAWWLDVPFRILDDEEDDTNTAEMYEGTDVVGSTCPCAGLSALSPTSHADSAINDWLYITSEHVLGTIRPKVYWGENAPALSSEKGRPVAERLRDIGIKHGYTFSMYRTKSSLHGLPQVRQRTFFFFWRDLDGTVPELPWIEQPKKTIESFFQDNRPRDKYSDLFIRKIKPSDMPIYRFVLDTLGVDHKTFIEKYIPKSMSLANFIREDYVAKGKLLESAIEHFSKSNNPKELKMLLFWKKKFDEGSGVIERYLILPKDINGAFVGQQPHCMTHPTEDRFLNMREMLDMMGMPIDFTLINPIRNVNHICQNVPVKTATDVALLIKDYLGGKLRLLPIGKEGIPIFDNMRKVALGVESIRQRSIF